MPNARISGTGFFVPPKVMTNHDLSQFMDTNDEWIQERTGIKERRYVENGVSTSDIAIPAVEMAMERAAVTKHDIGLIIFATSTPDYYAPGSGCLLQEKMDFPYLLLLISGGHTQFLIVKGVNQYEQLGTTIDDALGEAFDKTAKMLDLGYPGGPSVEKFAKLGDKDSVKLPEPIINRAGCNLSFAGLKTAVLRESKKINGEDKLRYNLAASFQNTINKILYKKTKVAVGMFREKIKKENFQLIVAGGVAANESIRNNLSYLSKEMNFKTIYPDLKFCGDNAAMIAWAGIQRFKKNLIDDVDVSAKSRWPLDSGAPYMKGPGLKL